MGAVQVLPKRVPLGRDHCATDPILATLLLTVCVQTHVFALGLYWSSFHDLKF